MYIRHAMTITLVQ